MNSSLSGPIDRLRYSGKMRKLITYIQAYTSLADNISKRLCP